MDLFFRFILVLCVVALYAGLFAVFRTRQWIAETNNALRMTNLQLRQLSEKMKLLDERTKPKDNGADARNFNHNRFDR